MKLVKDMDFSRFADYTVLVVVLSTCLSCVQLAYGRSCVLAEYNEVNFHSIISFCLLNLQMPLFRRFMPLCSLFHAISCTLGTNNSRLCSASVRSPRGVINLMFWCTEGHGLITSESCDSKSLSYIKILFT